MVEISAYDDQHSATSAVQFDSLIASRSLRQGSYASPLQLQEPAKLSRSSLRIKSQGSDKSRHSRTIYLKYLYLHGSYSTLIYPKSELFCDPAYPIHYIREAALISGSTACRSKPRQQWSFIPSYADTRIPQEETDEGVVRSKRLSLLKPSHKPDNPYHLQRFRQFNRLCLISVYSSASSGRASIYSSYQAR